MNILPTLNTKKETIQAKSNWYVTENKVIFIPNSFFIVPTTVIHGVYKSTNTKNEIAESAVKCNAKTDVRFPAKITLIDETTVSLAISPVSNETEACQLPNPKGLNIGAINPPIYDKILLFTSVIPLKLKFD